jgi:hypothetical protein
MFPLVVPTEVVVPFVAKAQSNRMPVVSSCLLCRVIQWVRLIIIIILQPVHQWFPSHISGCASCGQNPSKITSCDTACNMTLPGVIAVLDKYYPCLSAARGKHAGVANACWQCKRGGVEGTFIAMAWEGCFECLTKATTQLASVACTSCWGTIFPPTGPAPHVRLNVRLNALSAHSRQLCL